jgi:hypothetical protein
VGHMFLRLARCPARGTGGALPLAWHEYMSLVMPMLLVVITLVTCRCRKSCWAIQSSMLQRALRTPGTTDVPHFILSSTSRYVYFLVML